ncbi:MAG: sugar transferase [Chloroflexi bacterium]|nr:sugar transferase [Chloroflexota bacterium]
MAIRIDDLKLAPPRRRGPVEYLPPDPWVDGGHGPLDQRGRLMRRLLLVADIAALCIAFLVQEALLGPLHATDALLLAAGIPLWALLAHGHRLYHLDSHRADYGAADEFGPVLQAATLWCWATVLALWAVRPEDTVVPRIALFWGLLVALVMGLRSVTRALARRRDWYLQEALVIGPDHQVQAILRKIQRHPEWGIRATAYVAPGRDQPSPPTRARRQDDVDIPNDEDLIELVSMLGVDRVMLTPAMTEQSRHVELICGLTEIGVHIDLVPSWSDVVGARLDLNEMEGMPLLTIPRTGLRRSALRLKRMFDIAVAGSALVVLSPLLLACAIMIKLDSPGPVLFRQRRVGRDDRSFALLKFRSMCADAEQHKDVVAELNFHGGGNDSGMFKVRHDPRITRVGAVLRRYSIDELPQLLNILRGDMSLVGPRPLIENEDRQVEGRYRRRLRLTPGLTGLWQAHGRSDIPFQEMVSLDYLYVTNWSLWGDMKLLMRTFTAVRRGLGAY